MQVPNLLVVSNAMPVKNVREFLDYLHGQSGQDLVRLLRQRHVRSTCQPNYSRP